ncbi:single-stranded DNA-binding protein [Agrococcus sp. 1P02AA]|uniref:single-stranded DNA-binding protein n=1 Tax=Agrococcus sp. 1P02AA TaxID=3132259 RepID=UPI0039A55636
MNDAITVVGQLGADPTLKSINGDRVAEFRVACTSRRKDGDSWVDAHTNWYSVEAWGGFADHVGTSLQKGDLVMVLGRLKIDQWESGDKRGTSVRIRADHVGHSLKVGPTLRQRTQKALESSDSASLPHERGDQQHEHGEPAWSTALTSGSGASAGYGT